MYGGVYIINAAKNIIKPSTIISGLSPTNFNKNGLVIPAIGLATEKIVNTAPTVFPILDLEADICTAEK